MPASYEKSSKKRALEVLFQIVKSGDTGMTRKELAHLFEVSEDTILHDIRYAREAGFNIVNSLYPHYVYICKNVAFIKK